MQAWQGTKPMVDAKASASNYGLARRGLAVIGGIPAGTSICCPVRNTLDFFLQFAIFSQQSRYCAPTA
jgi:hypothetical protein